MHEDLTYRERLRLEKEIEIIKDEPTYRRVPAIMWRINLIKFEQTVSKGKIAQASKEFCKNNKTSLATLYRKRAAYNKYGIQGLLPNYGVNSNKNVKMNGSKYLQMQNLVDLRNPFDAIIAMVTTLAKSHSMKPPKVLLLNKLIEYIHSLKRQSGQNKTLQIKRVVTEEDIALIQELKHSNHKNVVKRARVIELLLNKEPLFSIMEKVNCGRMVPYRYRDKFESEGMKFFSIRYNEEKTKQILVDRQNKIAKIIHYPPSHYNINRSSWSLNTLADAYFMEYNEKIYPALISRTLKTLGYSFKKAKKVLTSEDPLYEKKVAIIKDVKMNLTVDDAFYFVDEAGPWAVKKYGGKSLTASGEQKIYPQYQKSKGSITFIAAYELVKKTILWEFIDKKDSESVVKMLKIIVDFTKHKKKMYVTWDTPSWHSSKIVNDFVNTNNISGSPEIIIVPLPSKAQYLNNIEAYFSGMKKAIIHNSDYSSADEMKNAIVRYFREKNLKNMKSYFSGNNINREKDFESGMYKKIN